MEKLHFTQFKQNALFRAFNYSLFGLFALVTLYPVWDVVMGSFMSLGEYSRSVFKLYPRSPVLTAYVALFADHDVLTPLKNSILVTVFGTSFGLLVMTMGAYSLSRPYLYGRKWIFLFILITMVFNGGMIPSYLIARSLGLVDTLGALIIIPSVNTFYLLIMKTYFTSVPSSLVESAKAEGANEFFILRKIIVPTSMPILATMILFIGVDRWNDLYNSILYINDRRKEPLQYFLYRLVAGSTMPQAMEITAAADLNVFPATLRMAAVTITTIPILLVYPFLQKYFVKGVMIGSIKE